MTLDAIPATTAFLDGDSPSTGSLRGAEPLFALERHHAAALEAAGRLDDAARSIRAKGFTASSFEAIARTAGFLEEFFARHQAIAESHLLPALQRLDAAQAREFREEHRSLRRLVVRILGLVREIEGGRVHGLSVGDLLRTSSELVSLIRRHVIHENDALFPLIRERLTGAGSPARGNAVPPRGF